MLSGASGFLYYVSVAGVTGTKSFAAEDVAAARGAHPAQAPLPCAVGFGIRTPEQAAAVARIADGVVVGSAIVQPSRQSWRQAGRRGDIVDGVLEFCRSLADAVHRARWIPAIAITVRICVVKSPA